PTPQFPTPKRLPTSNFQLVQLPTWLTIGDWELEVAWRLGVGFWELSEKHPVQLSSGDLEVRRAPNRPPVAQQDGLRRLVGDPEAVGRGVRHAAVALDGDELVGRALGAAVEVRQQLVERFTADAARAAVFEEEHRTLARFGDCGLEPVEVRQLSESV